MLRCGRKVLWSGNWWILGLMSLVVLFMLLFGLFIVSYKILKRNVGIGNYGELMTPYGGSSLIGSSSFKGGIVTKYPAAIVESENEQYDRLNIWVSRIFIAIVLQCTALYLMSRFPGTESPFWLGIVLQGFTYSSAALFYASGKNELE
jgi:hypothetical protein